MPIACGKPLKIVVIHSVAARVTAGVPAPESVGDLNLLIFDKESKYIVTTAVLKQEQRSHSELNICLRSAEKIIFTFIRNARVLNFLCLDWFATA